MSAVAFDTHKFVRRLKESGMPEPQAEAIADAFKDAQGEADLATKADLAELRQDVARLESKMESHLARLESKLNVVEERFTGRFNLLYWMVGFQLAIMVAVLWKLIR